MARKNTLTPGVIETDTSSLPYTKENVRIDQLIPQDILADKTKLREFLEAYYSFMNMDEFLYQETKTFSDVVLDNVARFRIPDPTSDGTEFFTDDAGANSTLTLTSPSGNSPAKFTFDGSSSSIVNTTNNTLVVGEFFQKAAPVGTLLTYSIGDGTAIGGLSADQNYFVISSQAGTIKLSGTVDGAAINLSSVGTGVIHSLRGATATMTIPLSATNVAISNGNELPGSLATTTSEVGKTFTVTNLSSFNGYSASLSTIVKNWTGPGPSKVMNTIEQAMNIDENATNYLELMQKEIAEAIPRNASTNKRSLYKRMVDFYKLRGTQDSIEIFFRLLFDDEVEVEYPWNNTLIASEGDWNQDADITSVINGAVSNSVNLVVDATDENIRAGATLIFGTTYKLSDAIKVAAVSGRNITLDTAVTLADNAVITFRPKGTYLDNKGFVSYNNKLTDSQRYQKFSYLIKSGLNLSQWENAFDKLVHPAGFIYFAEILIYLRLVSDELTAALNLAAMPQIQPGVIGPEDIPVLVEIFLSMFLPQTTGNIHKSGTISLTLKNGVISGANVTSGGSGYTSAPTVTTSDDAAASGFTTATIAATISSSGSTGGQVTGITITNGGENYGTPVGTISAPTAITFDGSDDEVTNVGIVNISDNTIKLTTAQGNALPIDSLVTYSSGGGTSIGGLTTGNQYYVVYNQAAESGKTKIKLSSTEGGSIIDITSVGSGTSHSFTGQTATVTFSKTDGKLKSIEVAEKGFGYASNLSPLSVSFTGDAQQGVTPVVPSASIGLTASGELDKDAITISQEGGGYSNLFGTVPANSNATKVASVTFIGTAEKKFNLNNFTYSNSLSHYIGPEIIFPAPTAKDNDGNLLSTNVQATAYFTLDNNGEISGAYVSNAGSGYVLDPVVRVSSLVQNEARVKETKEIQQIELNHTDVDDLITSIATNPKQTSGSLRGRTLYNGGLLEIGVIDNSTDTGAGDGNWVITQSSTANDKILPEHKVKVINNNYRTIINNGYIQRKGDNFYTSSRLYNSNQKIDFLGDIQIQNVDSTNINKYNTRTFVDID